MNNYKTHKENQNSSPNILINLAQRTSFDDLGDHTLDSGKEYTQYRFDSRNIYGDFTVLSVPKEFASEQTARLKFYEFLEDNFFSARGGN